jgi:hypothetical protein
LLHYHLYKILLTHLLFAETFKFQSKFNKIIRHSCPVSYKFCKNFMSLQNVKDNLSLDMLLFHYSYTTKVNSCNQIISIYYLIIIRIDISIGIQYLYIRMQYTIKKRYVPVRAADKPPDFKCKDRNNCK